MDPDKFDTDEGSDDAMPTAPFWMTTFSDMVTLLMVFFVLIVSMSTVQQKKFEEALSYFQGQTGVLQQSAVVPSTSSPTTEPKTIERAQQFEEFIQKLRENDLEDKIQVNQTEEGLHVVINDSVMFRSGQAQIIDPARSILRMLSQALTEEVESVVVEGHTDDRPIHTNTYPSNWELSAARAASVIRFMRNQPGALDPGSYVALGYGEHQARASNATVRGRAQNRRVEILLSWQPWQNKINPTLAQTTGSN